MKIARDKLMHGLAGGWVGYPVAMFVLVVTGLWYVALLAAAGAGGLVGWAWEEWQAYRNARAIRLGLHAPHAVETADVQATSLGATLSGCLALATALLIAWVLR
jgi:hypothetical protein